MEYFTTKSPRIRIISLRNGGIATMRKRITIQEKFELIMECRNSGLSDYQ